jgi:outer membrane receptor protein involved in Fe transport
VLPGTVGSQTGPSYYTLDVRLKYTYKLAGSQKVEFFLDVFNILDKQSATAEQGLIGGNGAQAFGEATSWVEPRRLYVGARYSF